MKMNFRFTDNFHMEDVSFEGLSGQEFAGSLKEALGMLKIENPVLGLMEDLEKGRYRDDELEPLLNTMQMISSLWDNPKEDYWMKEEGEKNVLMLLAAAIELISRLQRENQKWYESF